MKKKHKLYLKINIISLFFIIISFSSVTLAWFAYSGLTKASMDIGVKGWYIEMDKNGTPISKDVIITLNDIYPGMNTVEEVVTIKNHGDYDASVKYSIVSARILDDVNDNYIVNGTNITSEYVEDRLSHYYPFHINMSLDRNYVVSNSNNNATFKVSISWPLDSGNNIYDSSWGTSAFQYQNNVANQDQSSIKIVISLTAEQYIEDSSESSDPRYNLGDMVLFDVVSNLKCNEISATCLETYIIDKNSTLGDTTVKLLPNPNNINVISNYHNYHTNFNEMVSSWNDNLKKNNINELDVSNILNLLSFDITNSLKIKPNISDSVIGYLGYDNRIGNEVDNMININGYYKYLNSNFNYLLVDTCFWTNSNYNSNEAFAVTKIDNTYSKLYAEDKNTICKVVPIITVSKANLQ